MKENVCNFKQSQLFGNPQMYYIQWKEWAP